MSQIAILGCGPAGLLAAHAATIAGHEPVVYSRKEKSLIGGAQYVHRPIPGATPDEPDFEVTFRKLGTREGYAEKVYGSPDAPCSWEEFEEGPTPAWSMRTMYDWLWAAYSDLITPFEFSPMMAAEQMHTLTDSYEYIVSSIPARALCWNPAHRFEATSVHILGQAWREVEPNEVVYSGERIVPWYRSSLIDGIGSTEFRVMPRDTKYAAKGEAVVAAPLFKGIKPIWTNCNCWSERVSRVGRFGKFQKGILVHEAYADTLKILDYQRAPS